MTVSTTNQRELRQAVILVTPEVKRLLYYFENRPYDSVLDIRSHTTMMRVLSAMMYDRTREIAPDTNTLRFDSHTEKLPILVERGHHITERNLKRFCDIVMRHFIDRLVSFSAATAKYGISEISIVRTELDRAGLSDYISVEALAKSVYRLRCELKPSPYKFV